VLSIVSGRAVSNPREGQLMVTLCALGMAPIFADTGASGMAHGNAWGSLVSSTGWLIYTVIATAGRASAPLCKQDNKHPKFCYYYYLFIFPGKRTAA
jgi:hypothetical protein